jgi:hypothetical protein
MLHHSGASTLFAQCYVKTIAVLRRTTNTSIWTHSGVHVSANDLIETNSLYKGEGKGAWS